MLRSVALSSGFHRFLWGLFFTKWRERRTYIPEEDGNENSVGLEQVLKPVVLQRLPDLVRKLLSGYEARATSEAVKLLEQPGLRAQHF